MYFPKWCQQKTPHLCYMLLLEWLLEFSWFHWQLLRVFFVQSTTYVINRLRGIVVFDFVSWIKFSVSILLVVFRPLVPSGTAVYSPVQASCTDDGGVATLYVNDPAAHQINVEEKPSFRLQRNHIHIGSTLLEGTFGSIFHATLQIPGMPMKDVIVKTVKSIRPCTNFFLYSYFLLLSFIF